MGNRSKFKLLAAFNPKDYFDEYDNDGDYVGFFVRLNRDYENQPITISLLEKVIQLCVKHLKCFDVPNPACEDIRLKYHEYCSKCESMELHQTEKGNLLDMTQLLNAQMVVYLDRMINCTPKTIRKRFDKCNTFQEYCDEWDKIESERVSV